MPNPLPESLEVRQARVEDTASLTALVAFSPVPKLLLVRSTAPFIHECVYEEIVLYVSLIVLSLASFFIHTRVDQRCRATDIAAFHGKVIEVVETRAGHTARYSKKMRTQRGEVKWGSRDERRFGRGPLGGGGEDSNGIVFLYSIGFWAAFLINFLSAKCLQRLFSGGCSWEGSTLGFR